MIQVDPHRNGETEHNVEARLFQSTKMLVQCPVTIVDQKIETLKNDTIRPWIAFPCPFD